MAEAYKRPAGQKPAPSPLLKADAYPEPSDEVASVDPTVDHPEYYGGKGNPYEAIEVIRSWIGSDSTLGFCVGNTLKYLCRAGRKEPDSFSSLKQDLMKARWYLDYAIGILESEE